MRMRTRAGLMGLLVAVLGMTLGLTAADGAKKGKKKGPSVFKETKTVNAAVANVPALGPATPVRSTITIGKKFKGKVVGDVDVTGLRTTGSAAGAANDIIFKLTGPSGRTVRLSNGHGDQNLGPWTIDDESRTSICDSDTLNCVDPDATLIRPFAGTSSLLTAGTGGTGPLSMFDGQPMRGKWTLTVFDNDDPTTSTFNSWGLKIIAAKPSQAAASKKGKKKSSSVFSRSIASPMAIPDRAVGERAVEVFNSITVPKSFKGRVVGDVNVTGITATGNNAVSDLALHLVAPSGRTVRLTDGIGDDAIGPLTFDDDTPRAICNDIDTDNCVDPDQTLIQPFAGTASLFLQQTGDTGPLAKLNGIKMAGTWRLGIIDESAGGTNVLNGWGLKITAAKPVAGSKPAAKASAKKKPKGKSSVAITKTVNQAIPDDPGAGPSTPLRSTVTIGKAFKGKTVGDLNVTGFQTTGDNPSSAADIVAKLTAPNGKTVRLLNGGGGQNIGPWTIDDDTHVSNCFNPNPAVCTPPFDLGVPWAGTSNLMFMSTAGSGPLQTFNGAPIKGTWTFTVFDDDPTETSTFNSWGLKITAAKPIKG